MITLKRLSYRYPGSQANALRAVDLSARAGSVTVVAGESGSGKTTLLRLLAGFIAPEGGTIDIGGQRVSEPGRAVAPEERGVGVVFQEFALFPHLTVEQNVAFGLNRSEPRTRAARVRECVEMLGIESLLGRYPHELSGGQARRVGVARALALNPRLIIADEPTAGLDVSVQGDILNLMADLQAEHGLSYLVITHNLPVVRHIADRLAIMYLGRIVEQGPTDAVFTAPRHPYTRALVEGVPRPDPDRRRTHVSISGEVPSLLTRPKGCDFVTRCPFATDLCRHEKPPQEMTGDARKFACFHPLEG